MAPSEGALVGTRSAHQRGHKVGDGVPHKVTLLWEIYKPHH